MKAVWNGTVIAESNATVVIEGHHYFPPKDVHHEFLKPSETHTTCAWRGLASYYSIEVGGEMVKDAAWFYSAPRRAAEEIRDYVAFWRGVEITV
jgi:uncharacterized protein (DUF427 family)